MDEAARWALFWEGSAKEDFMMFPVPVRKDLGVALFVVQIGGTPSSAKPWKGLVPAFTNWLTITAAMRIAPFTR